jgi:hypothetical protein
MAAEHRHILARVLTRLAGLLLLVVALGGVLYASRVSLAQYRYHQLRKTVEKPGEGFAAEVLELHASYPRNYHLLAWAAEMAHDRALRLDGAARLTAFEETGLLCDAGLDLNPHRVPLPIIKTSLISQASLAEAIIYWEAFVAWDYWNPYNHAYLAELYAAAGRFGDAARALNLIQDTPFAASASRALRRAYEREAQFPAGL